MRKTAFALALLAAPTVLIAEHLPISIGHTTLHPVNQSGAHGEFAFLDNGSTLMILGSASGLDPSTIYVSLIYDNGSVPGGPTACEPTIFDPSDPDFLLPTMFIGAWTVQSDGTGTLTETNVFDEISGQRVYVPLTRFRTTSIRDTSINGGIGPEAVVACGHVAEHPGG
ncbi:MAG: hypothetical protein ACRD2Z_00440 [Thermoanaerobaculia bacterium]